jgi:hypothetical protein
MKRNPSAFAAAGPLLVALLAAAPASAQKAGGILKMYTVDSPASMSILEEATVFAERPMMGVFNNLVMYDQHVQLNRRPLPQRISFACSRSCPISRQAGRGVKMGPSSHSHCVKDARPQ